ncbi:MAG TPA: phosphoglycolate phosphatase [Devosia sp.]|nr:phosphoglycolate phosphatase [Devosia sp.]
MRAIIFDLDGTLVDSAPGIHAAACQMLAAHGHKPIDLSTARSFIGNGIGKFVERIMRQANIGFSSTTHKQLTTEFTRIYAGNPALHTTLYPGVRQALEQLKSAEFALGVCTNKIHAISVQMLETLDISDFFSSVIGGDSLSTNKPDPAMLFASMEELGASDAIFIGDSEVDAATAQAARVPFVLFTEGYLTAPQTGLTYARSFGEFSELHNIIGTINPS